MTIGARLFNDHRSGRSDRGLESGGGVPVNVISAALGHASVATTATYLAHIQPQEVIDTLRSRSWEV